MKKLIKSVVVLVAICAVVSVLMAFTNYITAPIIAKNEAGKANEALSEVLPGGEGFELVDISAYTLPATVTEVYKASNGGYVVKLKTSGFAPNMVIMCGINADGTVAGALCLSSEETNGAEKTYGSSFVGKDSTGVDSVDTVSGSTMTTTAYRAAIKDALNTATILGGGSVDIRTDEEIFLDNLAQALPAANGEFEKYLFLEELKGGPDVIYVAKNGGGYVAIFDTTPQTFIGVDANGKVITDCDADQKSSVEASIEAIMAITLTEIDLADYEDALKDAGAFKYLESVKKTNSGNYDITIKAEGYSMYTSKYGGKGEYIRIRVSLTAEGKIIDTLTLTHAESKGIGDICATEGYYSQFDGKTEQTYDEVDTIAGITKTTGGYKKAILNAFKTVKILEGGTP